jgi:nucleoside-diphosphate-sugar epimerase
MKQSATASILIVGCGDLGGKVAQALSVLGHQVTGVSRSARPLDGVSMLWADVTLPDTLTALYSLAPHIIIYCVAANRQQHAQMNAEYKACYVDGLQNILATQTHNPHLKSVFFVSSTRVYGQSTAEILDEDTPVIPNDVGGERLLQAEQLLNGLSCQSTVLRLSGIYGAGRLRMLTLAQSPEKWPQMNTWTNRIHRDDAAAFIVHLVNLRLADQKINRCYIVTDSTPSTQYDVLNWLAKRLSVLVETQQSVAVSGGKRLSNRQMLATGFKLQYPDYASGYASLLAADQ